MSTQINAPIDISKLTPKEVKYLMDAGKEFNSYFDTPEMPTKEKVGTIPGHGVTALLNSAGVRPDMYSAMPGVYTFAEALPMFSNPYNTDKFEIITGQNAAIGTNPNDVCSAPLQAGYLKVMQHSVEFGTAFMGTKETNIITDFVFKDRADIMRRLNNWGGAAMSKFMPTFPGMDINTAIGKELLEWTNEMAKSISHVNIQGLVTNTGASGANGIIGEWDGLTRWIRDDYTDDISSVAAPAVNSLVTDYGSGTIDATWYTHYANVIRYLVMTAKNSGIGEVIWGNVVHPYQVFPMVDIVACNFNTTRCTTTGINDGLALEIAGRRRSMQEEMYIPVDNKRIPFVEDWGVPATYDAATAVWESDTLIVPLIRVSTGEALTYMEYKPVNILGADLIQRLPKDKDYLPFGGDMWVGWQEGNHGCFHYEFAGQFRMVMRTPFLAARVDNNSYLNDTPFASPIIGETYYRDGGQYKRT